MDYICFFSTGEDSKGLDSDFFPLVGTAVYISVPSASDRIWGESLEVSDE